MQPDSPTGNLGRWWATARPRTLVLSAAPVLLGTTLGATNSGALSWAPMLSGLLAAMLIQVGTNLHNDAADFERGVDNHHRTGPLRAAQQGWFSANAIRQAALLCFCAAFLLGIHLACHGGWPIVLIGIASLISGYLYTGGPHPIAYGPTGEIFVLLFFGVIAVAGSDYLQTLHFQEQALLSGIILGLPAAAVLLLNNYRDLETDREAGRRTLVHYLGRGNSRRLYAVFILAPTFLSWPILPAAAPPLLLSLPAGLWLVYHLWQRPPGPALNPLLAHTALYTLMVATLSSVGIILV